MPSLNDLASIALDYLAEVPALLAVFAFVAAVVMWADVLTTR